MEGRLDEALTKIKNCEWTLKIRCQPLENAYLHMTAFTVYTQKNQTSPGKLQY